MIEDDERLSEMVAEYLGGVGLRVSARAEGAAGLEALRTYLESYWADTLAAFKSVADRGDEGREP